MTLNTHRSNTLHSLLLVCTLSLLSLVNSTVSSAQGKVYNWRVAHTWPDNFPLFIEPLKSLSSHAKTLSNGRLNITFEGSSTHKRPFGIFDMVQNKEYQMGQSVGFYWQNKDINTAILSSMPFGMIAQERYSWFYNGGGRELTEKVYSKHGLKSYPAGNIGMQMGGWFKKEINTLDDLKGLKMRIPGLGGSVMQAMGVEPFNLQTSKLYDALKSGELDAIDWANPGIDLSMKFFDHAKYYYTGWQEPSVELQFLVNQEAFNRLPNDLQAVLESAIKLASFETFINYNHRNIVQFKRMLEAHPEIKIRAFPAKIMRALAKETRNELQKLIETSDDPLTKEIINSQLNYQNQARQWTRFGDQAYLNNTFPLSAF